MSRYQVEILMAAFLVDNSGCMAAAGGHYLDFVTNNYGCLGTNGRYLWPLFSN